MERAKDTVIQVALRPGSKGLQLVAMRLHPKKASPSPEHTQCYHSKAQTHGGAGRVMVSNVRAPDHFQNLITVQKATYGFILAIILFSFQEIF